MQQGQLPKQHQQVQSRRLSHLVLGAIASWFGGRSGVVHPIYADGVVPSRRRL